MNVMDAIYARRSVRAYTGEPLPRETLETLLKAAVQSPTGMNMQPWAFGIIEGAERLKIFSDRTKAYLLEHIAEFPMFARYHDLMANPEVNLFHNAPALIIVFSKPGGATTEMDCTMAAQTIMLAAVEMELATCWVGFSAILLNQPDVKKELGIPEDYQTVAPIAIGKPVSIPSAPPKNDPEIVFWLS